MLNLIIQALKQIQEILDPLAIPELWDSLLRKRMQDTEKLTRLQLEQENNETPGRSFDEAWKIGLASVEAQIITSTLEAMIHKEKLQNHLQNVVNIIDKIMVNNYTNYYLLKNTLNLKCHIFFYRSVIRNKN